MNTTDKALTQYYNLVEERVIKMMGGYDLAAAWFDEHRSIGDLYDHSVRCYKKNWNYQRAAKKWYQENVKKRKNYDSGYTPRGRSYISKGTSLIETTGTTTYYSSSWNRKQDRKKQWKRLPVLV